MSRAFACVCLTLFAAVPAGAASFAPSLREANALLEGGLPSEALARYRDLQTERPDDAGLPYNIGNANLALAASKAEAGQMNEALAALDEARSAFERAAAMTSGELQARARFNHANAGLERAKMLRATGDYALTARAFESAVRDYERMLEVHPEHGPARHNLAHARLLWKRLLQEPPEEPEAEQEPQQQPPQQRPGASVSHAETDLEGATLETLTEEASASVRLLEPDGEEQP